MRLDKHRLLNPTDEDRADVAAHELPPLVVLPPKAVKNIEQGQSDMWASFGAHVMKRLRHEQYQKLVTYCLMAKVSPSTVAKVIKDYVETGKVPWQQ